MSEAFVFVLLAVSVIGRVMLVVVVVGGVPAEG